MPADPILVFAGSGSPRLTRGICEYLGVEPAACEVLRFSEGNLFVRVQENGKKARNFARRLGTSLAIAEKERSAHDERADVLELIGEVEGRTALLVD
ncbi:MAG: ribose-phosphate pyrophosphokinase-like domain-containing protein, partial [Proteobacteria bacterium]|nr:ribose-phosphate pyrophosphokinase-like domain-containing protein [Pseudomonadota bacterium]